jgi:Uma2 family endonuclease
VGKTGPAPQVIVEIGAQETWKKDLEEKPMQYMLMGVQEYFAYDPNIPSLSRSTSQRLFGWDLDKSQGAIYEIPQGQMGVCGVGIWRAFWCQTTTICACRLASGKCV